MNNIELFEKHWKDFYKKLEYRIIKETEKSNTISCSLLNLILKDAAISWESDFDLNGKWLNEYLSYNPEKGKLIKSIISDMRFSELTVKKDYIQPLNFLIPVASAFAGYLIARECGANQVVQTVSAIAPAIVGTLPMRQIEKGIEKNNSLKSAKQYMQQLDKYKTSILSVLSE